MSILVEWTELAEKLSRYSRLCYDRRLVGAAGGNVSARVPGRDLALVTATGVSLRDVAPGNLLVADLRGGVVENRAGLRPSKETGFHLGIYRLRADVGAVIHVHPTYATVYSSLQIPVPLVTVSAENKLREGPLVRAASGGSEAPKIATPQIRSRGTFGGSPSHADPSAELVTVSVILDGSFRLRSQAGDRWIPAREFFVGMLTTQLEPDELLTEIAIPPLQPCSGWALMEITRRPHDFALVGVAVVVTLDDERRCHNARIGLLSVGDGPVEAQRLSRC